MRNKILWTSAPNFTRFVKSCPFESIFRRGLVPRVIVIMFQIPNDIGWITFLHFESYDEHYISAVMVRVGQGVKVKKMMIYHLLEMKSSCKAVWMKLKRRFSHKHILYLITRNFVWSFEIRDTCSYNNNLTFRYDEGVERWSSLL